MGSAVRYAGALQRKAHGVSPYGRQYEFFFRAARVNATVCHKKCPTNAHLLKTRCAIGSSSDSRVDLKLQPFEAMYWMWDRGFSSWRLLAIAFALTDSSVFASVMQRT